VERATRRSVCGGNASCWASTAPGCITIPWARAKRTPVPAVAGRAVHTGAVLWEPENDGVAGERRPSSQRKRVSRLMELLGIEAVYPKPKLSQRGKATGSTRTC